MSWNLQELAPSILSRKSLWMVVKISAIQNELKTPKVLMLPISIESTVSCMYHISFP